VKDNSTNNTKKKVAVVTGKSSGIGLETSLTLTGNTFRACATMRNLDKESNVLDMGKKKNLLMEEARLDITDEFSVHQAIQLIAEKEEDK
jgi:NADP-dependent 3-hydroxy acid dehydrogenase YdfG